MLICPRWGVLRLLLNLPFLFLSLLFPLFLLYLFERKRAGCGLCIHVNNLPEPTMLWPSPLWRERALFSIQGHCALKIIPGYIQSCRALVLSYASLYPPLHKFQDRYVCRRIFQVSYEPRSTSSSVPRHGAR